MQRGRSAFTSATVLSLAVSGVALAPMTACSGPKRDAGYVQREWSTTLRELGIVPIFPPREDVFVGDVYAYDFDPDSAETQKILQTKFERLSDPDKATRMKIGMSPRLARIDLTGEASQEYRDTPSWPASTPSVAATLGSPDLPALRTHRQKLEDAVATAKRAFADFEAEATTYPRLFADATAEHNAASGRRDGAQAARDSARSDLKSTRDSLRLTREKLAATDASKTEEIARLNRLITELETREKEQATRLKSFDDEMLIAERNVAHGNKELERVRALQSGEQAARTKHKDRIEREEKALNAFSALELELRANTILVPRQPQAENNTNVFDATGTDDTRRVDRTNRLRLVGFPDFSSTTFTQGELNALIPIEAFALGGRLNFTRVRRVSVKVPAAESYSVPIEEVWRAVAKAYETTDREEKALKLKQSLNTAASFQFHRTDEQGKVTKREPVYLRVATEVFYARALDISIEATRAAGARVELETIKPFDSVKDQAPSPINLQNPQPATTTGDPDSLTNAQILARTEAQLGERLKVPGGSVQLVSLTSTHVGVRRVFDRPVAIGFRGVTLKVESDGTVTRVAVPVGAVPKGTTDNPQPNK
jgi:hypothetical protein